MNPEIRPVTADDADALLRIYAPYVRETAVTFEYEVPSPAEFRERIRRIGERYPYLAAVTDGEITGYAYAAVFKNRPAYDWAVETSVYIRRDRRRQGTGHVLYAALEECLRAQGILNMNACVAVPPAAEDEYLTRGSVLFHEKEGFCPVGTFHRCGYKFDRWYDMVWMEKEIGVHRAGQPPVIPFPETGRESSGFSGLKDRALK